MQWSLSEIGSRMLACSSVGLGDCTARESVRCISFCTPGCSLGALMKSHGCSGAKTSPSTGVERPVTVLLLQAGCNATER